MKVEVFYFDGCPSHEAVLARLREIVSQLEADAEIELRHIKTLDEAERQRFLGSPTVHIDGEDIEPGSAQRTDFGLKCRLYRTSNGGQQGVPPDDLISAAIARRSDG